MGIKVKKPPYMAGEIIQVVNVQDGEYKLLPVANLIPADDTIPQITEGTEIMTLAITPKYANSKLKIEVVAHITPDAGTMMCVALFETTTHATNALDCGVEDTGTAGRISNMKFTHYMTAPGTDTYTFRVRGGCDGGDSYFNGNSGSGRLYGGVLASSITITEIKQ